MVLKQLTDVEAKLYHRKSRARIILEYIERQVEKSVTDRVKDYEPINEYQSEWVDNRLKGDAISWERWFVGLYFTEEQKWTMIGLTDKDITGEGMK